MNRILKALTSWRLPAAILALSAWSARADTIAFTPGMEVGGGMSFTGTRGYRFASRIGQDILITQLGVFDSGGDGLVNPHEIGLWVDDSNISGTLLVSVTVPAGTEAPLIGGFRWVEIPPVLLQPGFPTHTIAAHYVEGDADDLTKPYLPQFAPEVGPTAGNGRYWLSADLAYPASLTFGGEGQIGERFFQANFQYVVIPEPAAWMLISSAALLFLIRRRGRS